MKIKVTFQGTLRGIIESALLAEALFGPFHGSHHHVFKQWGMEEGGRVRISSESFYERKYSHAKDTID